MARRGGNRARLDPGRIRLHPYPEYLRRHVLRFVAVRTHRCRGGLSAGVFLLTIAVTLAGTALFVVPGVRLSLGLSMAFFVLRDDADVSSDEAEMGDDAGAQAGLFLRLSLLGWVLAASGTLIGILWFIPYACTASAKFYDKLETNSKR